jgi:hypothetical protein
MAKPYKIMLKTEQAETNMQEKDVCHSATQSPVHSQVLCGDYHTLKALMSKHAKSKDGSTAYGYCYEGTHF